MKNQDVPDEVAPLMGPPRRCAGKGIRINALVATLVTCMAIFGIHDLFQDVKLGYLPHWKRPSKPPHREKAFQWSQIVASPQLKFHKCFDGFECAKLSLPLDYFNGTYPDETVSIAITKLPAKVHLDDPRYGGPILLNPGGPGGSGTLLALVLGKPLQDIVDPDIDANIDSTDVRYYDILGFDPRGIGESEPYAQCLDDPAAAWSWNLRENTEGILGSSDAALGRLWSMTHAWGSACKQVMDDASGPNIKQYMTTAIVARDMLEIIEKHAAYVAEVLDQSTAKGCRRSYEPDSALYTPSEAKLDYWGFSYGTFLGSTFASMFPERVGRVILDGVVSSYDYLHTLDNGSLTDSQKVMDSFYTFCVLAGPEACPLATSNSSAADVKNRVQGIVQSLYHNPLIINSPSGPEILTYSDVKALLFTSCYQPRPMFWFLARLLPAIEAGHDEILDGLGAGLSFSHIYSCSVNSPLPALERSMVATFSVLCSDGIDQSNISLDEFTEYWKFLDDMAPTSGAIWSMLRMRCAAWKIKAPYKYTGEYGGNTSHPILFLSNTADPVTPLRSGRIMSNLFPNSGLLVSDGAGHCSLSTPNLCVLTHVKTYFQTGALPPPNTLCVPPQSPFSLNSTDPKSPFYDPSLGKASVELEATAEQRNPSQSQLYRAGNRAALTIAESDMFGFQGVLGGERVRNVMMNAATEFNLYT
ncbi:TAP-like protein-domain-containing protein [Phaeosphaeriaceae sp. PMI808]|nr:TAP-like protein-domain-containing protein [Phaeosphaeriaceae sp. PMI808]